MNSYSNHIGKLSPTSSKVLLFYFLILSVPIFALALIGVLSRPALSLAAIWPANAFLLGMMARHPCLRNSKSYLFAFLGYFSSDLLIGTPLEENIILNLGNLVSVSAGLMCLKWLTGGVFPLCQSFGVVKLVVCAFSASIGASLIGMIAYPLLLDSSMYQGAIYWGVTEFANYIAFLPLVLTMPNLFQLAREITFPKWNLSLFIKLLPGLSVLLLCFLAIVINGPSAIAIPVLGLLWCGISYSLFTTTLITFFYCFWTLIAISSGHITILSELPSWGNLMSLRLSVSAIALVPLVNGITNQARLKQIAILQHSSNHDSLTGVLNRGAFYQKLNEQVERSAFQPFALLMLDLDNFKKVNDQFGHSSGDQVLKHFAHSTQSLLQNGDVIGRTGGEEFAIILQARDKSDFQSIAQQICDYIAGSPCYIDHTFYIPITVSIGAISLNEIDQVKVGGDNLMKIADEALYRAKAWGRNQIQFQEKPRRSH